MTYEKLKQALVALLFAAGDSVEIARLAELTQCSKPAVLSALESLNAQWEKEGFPLELLFLEENCQMVTRREYAPLIRQMLLIKQNVKLSQAALEVLAVIAYNQPVTRSFVEQVRGVDSSGIVASLEEKGLVEERGRLDLPGRPIAYGTTQDFLRCFGLRSLEDLPPVPSAGEGASDGEKTEGRGRSDEDE